MCGFFEPTKRKTNEKESDQWDIVPLSDVLGVNSEAAQFLFHYARHVNAWSCTEEQRLQDDQAPLALAQVEMRPEKHHLQGSMCSVLACRGG